MAFYPRSLMPFASALLLYACPVWASQAVIVNVNSSGLNVRTGSGAILCQAKNGSEMTAIGRADGDWLKVKLNAPGCPKEGFVHSGFVKAKNAPAATVTPATSAIVQNEGLSFRNKPDLSEESYECALPKGTKLSPTSAAAVTKGENTWIKVKIPPEVKDCPSEGWVSKSYVKWQTTVAALTSSPSGGLLALPEVTRQAVTPDSVPDCNGAGCNRSRPDPAISQMTRVSNGIGRQIADEAPPRPPAPIPPPLNANNVYLGAIKTLISNPRAKSTGLNTNRGLVQIPLLGSRGNIGPCGSHHYLPDRPIGSDVYTNPLTACVFTSVLQDWRKICPTRSGCTLQFGDISDRNDPGFRGNHKSHTQGLCIDIRPPRKGGFEDTPMTYTDSDYDRATARKLVGLLKANGVNTNQFFFNDTGLGTRAMSGHSNHIHACFPESAVTRNVCKNLKVDPQLCPEIP